MSVAPFTLPHTGWRQIASLLLAPAVVVFLSSNLVNVGNLAFNMIFSRLMGPELFGVLALLLTIKLALLGVMGALQMAVSQMVASSTGPEESQFEQALSRINRLLIVGLFSLGIPLTAGLVLVEMVVARLELPALHLLLMLLVAVPFGASLSILRGIAFGRMQAGRIVLSANAEMVVRLAGALLAWELGFGLEGVVFAISLSIVAGWIVLADLLPSPRTKLHVRTTAGILAASAAPFGLLQLSQVLALDGDIFLANAMLPASEAGFIGVLSLFQRIQFFACFALAGVLLPGVIIAVRDGSDVLRASTPVFALFFAVSIFLVIATLLMPSLMISLMVGDQYLAAAPVLIFAVMSAVCFTFSYLAATLLVALGHKIGILVVFAAALIQLAIMFLSCPSSFADLLKVKAMCQAATAMCLVLALLRYTRCAQNSPVTRST